MKKIGFYNPCLDLQGVCVSVFDYAYHNETILGNKSYIIYDKNDSRSHKLSIEKFKDNFELMGIEGSENSELLNNLCKELKLDALYIQKLGKINEGGYITDTPMFIHCVGVYNQPHGLVYSYVSEWLSSECFDNAFPFVPYMVNLPQTNENLREELKIPKDAIVFGRTGGTYSWNISFVNPVIEQVLKQRENVYFLLANTNEFIKHDRVIFHPPFVDLQYKRKFINSCDSFLHARLEGESYGASVAEFSTCNKPVITFKDSPERNHILTLQNKGIYYKDPDSLFNILMNFTPQPQLDWNAYKDFTPEKVMNKFKNVFIDKL